MIEKWVQNLKSKEFKQWSWIRMEHGYEKTVIKIFLLNFIIRLYDQWVAHSSFFVNGLSEFLKMIIGT